MATDYISVNRTKQLGNSLVRAADLMRELRELMDKLSDVIGHSQDGVTYTTLETNFGLTTGQGANLASLVALIQDILNTSTDVTGANRLSRLDEFCARLAGQ